MVNWNDPILLVEDYLTFVKLSNTIAGVYFWEVLITSGFELDVFRGKRPYRWTIWLYLGTRYTLLILLVLFFINIDAGTAPCHPVTIATFVLAYVSWAFASLIIVLRVIAIWNRNIIVSLIAVGAWLGTLTWGIWDMTFLATVYDPILDACVALVTRKDLLNTLGILIVDVILLLAMLVGLLRHPHRNSTGLWKFLYQQCIIWTALAVLSETPIVVFVMLDLNDAWNQMLLAPSLVIMSIGAARMYRSLSDRGSLTEYVSSDVPQFPSKKSITASPSMGATMHFVSVTQSDGPQTMGEAPVFPPTEQKHHDVVFVPGRLTPAFLTRTRKTRSL